VSGDEQHRDRTTGQSQAPSGRNEPAPALPALGLPPQRLPRILVRLIGPQRTPRGRLRRIRCLPRLRLLEQRCGAGRRLRRGAFSPYPIAQGTQLVDRQNLVSIRLIHNLT
jgi:hypothetical protein